MDQQALLVGDNGSKLQIELPEPSGPLSESGFSGVWISATVLVEVGGFRARVGTNFESVEISRWLAGLGSLLEGKARTFNLSSIEPCLGIDFESTTLGAIAVSGEVYSENPEGPSLTFGFQCDHTSLQRFCGELRRAVEKFGAGAF